MIKTCKYQKCGKQYESKRSDSNYCCASHRELDRYYRKKESPLQGPPTLPNTQLSLLPKSTPPMKIEKLQPPTQDIAAKWVIDQQKERITELKESLREKEVEIKSLTKEKIQLEKELVSVRESADAKPKGLAGFVQNNPSIIEKGMELFGPKLAELASKLLDPQPAQLGQGNNEIYNWLAAQPEGVQKAFITLIQALNQQPERMAENLHTLVQQLMKVSTPEKNIGRSY